MNNFLDKFSSFLGTTNKLIATLILIAFAFLLLSIVCCNAPNKDYGDYNDLQFDTYGDSGTINMIESLEYDSLSEFHHADFATNHLKRLVIHSTASNIKKPYTRETLLKFFTDTRKWSKPGYTFFIDRQGVIWKLNENWNWDAVITYSEITFGAQGYNSSSLHVAWDGGVENNKIVDNRTPEQKATLRSFVKLVIDIYPNIEVVGHSTLNPNKACPIFDVKKEYADIL